MDEKPDQAYMDHNTGKIHYGKETPAGEWQIAEGEKDQLKDMLAPITEMGLTSRKVPGYDPEAPHPEIVRTMGAFYGQVGEQQRRANELAQRMQKKRGRGR